MAVDRVLAVDIGRRPEGSDGNVRAREFVAASFKAAGYEVTLQPVKRLDGGTTFNVVARNPGADYSKGYVVVGGHYDTVPQSFGGNDNGSGTAVVVTVAEELFGARVAVEFVGFGGEEKQTTTKEHHIGSRGYVAALQDKSAVKAMASVDMVGVGSGMIVGVLKGTGDSLQKEVVAAGGEVGVPAKAQTLPDYSDHGAFAKAGIPAVYIWAGDDPRWHTAGDTFEIVQRDEVARAGTLVLGWLEKREGF
jgi:Zn-dependent M28 family amino/carboxypeptidase